MKKLRKIIALFSVIVIALSLVSCKRNRDPHVCSPDPWEFYPEGYTAGFPEMRRSWNRGSRDEIWWVETYEECIEAIDRLKSHGSEFSNISLLSYDGEFCDIKYCFIFPSVHKWSDQINFGDDPFDRKAINAIVYSCIFFDDTTIDEINYGDITDYHVYSAFAVNMKQANVTDSSLSYEWITDEDNKSTCLVYQSGELCYKFTRESKNPLPNDYMSDECIKALLNSIKIINVEGENI